MAGGFVDWLTKSSERGYPAQGGSDLEWLIRSGDRGYPTTTPTPVPAPAPAPVPASTPAPVPAQPSAQMVDNSRQGMTAFLSGRASNAPAPAPQPKSGDVVGSPISVVRALHNTNYLPVLDAQGRVSYQSEEFMREQAARAAAAEKARADLLKTKAGTAKDLSLSVPGQIQEYFLNMRKDLASTLATLPENDARRTGVTKELERLDAILAPKTSFFDAVTAAAYGKTTD